MRYTANLLTIVVASLLTGCTTSSVPSGSTVPVPPSLARVGGSAIRVDHGRSWMSPDAKGKDLLYLDDETTGDVQVFSYPKGVLEGTLTGLPEPQGECVDKKGDVFFTTFADYEIVEYAHGGTSPLATLDNPGEYMEGCSVDPTTGDLAAINFETTSHGPGGVSIYKKAKGNPTVYSDSNLYLGYALGYDDSGNIFVDGVDSSRNFEFAELPMGSSTFTTITLSVSINTPGGVQWDGKYVAVGDENDGNVYQTNGAGGKVLGTTTLSSADGLFNFFIDHNTIIGPNVFAADAMFWKYPAGGSPTKTLTGFDYPFGAAVSRKK